MYIRSGINIRNWNKCCSPGIVTKSESSIEIEFLPITIEKFFVTDAFVKKLVMII